MRNQLFVIKDQRTYLEKLFNIEEKEEFEEKEVKEEKEDIKVKKESNEKNSTNLSSSSKKKNDNEPKIQENRIEMDDEKNTDD